MIIMAVCYILIFHQVRTTRLSLEEYGVVAYHIKKRERNFSMMLIIIFSKYTRLMTFQYKFSILLKLHILHLSGPPNELE